MKKKINNNSRYRNRKYRNLRENIPNILIVTEGEKTELDYFKRLRKEYKLPKVNVNVISSKRSDPTHIVNESEKYISESGKEFEFVFCVFDRDNEKQFSKALDRIDKINKRKKVGYEKFVAITSVPCFEYWYLLHVDDSRRPYGTTGSACGELIKYLERKEKIFQDYDKGKSGDYFDFLVNLRSLAVNRSKNIFIQSDKNQRHLHHEDPSTRVFLIVEFFDKLKKLIQEINKV